MRLSTQPVDIQEALRQMTDTVPVYLHPSCVMDAIRTHSVAAQTTNVPVCKTSFLYDDRRIFQFLSAFGMPALDLNLDADQLLCLSARRNWTLLCLLINLALVIVLYVHVQLEWLARSNDWLASFTDAIRGLSNMYAYELLIVVALLHRQRYAAYFNYLNDIDRNFGQLFDIGPNRALVRRTFWVHSAWLLFIYVCVSTPMGIYFFGKASVPEASYMIEYAVMAIMMGMVTMFLQYAAHSCQIRYACARECLSVAMGRASVRLVEVKSAIRLLSDVDQAMEQLNESFGTLLACKLTIDGTNTILVVFITMFKLTHDGLVHKVRLLDYVLYEWPYIFVAFLMVRYFQAIGDEVSEKENGRIGFE